MTASDPSQNVYQFIPVFAGDERPSLEPSKDRLGQAAQRLNDLAKALHELEGRARQHRVVIWVDKALVDAGQPSPRNIEWDQLEPDGVRLHQLARLLTGEVVYHLRTCLEYLAYHLVWLDRGKPYERSQFPIATNRAAWSIARKRVPGLTAQHLAHVERLQPFSGTNWTRDLAELSNSDKHRRTLSLVIGPGAVVPLDPTDVTPDPAHPDRYRVLANRPDARVTTEDGRRLIDVLYGLCAGAVDAVNQFAPDFGELADVKLSLGGVSSGP